jgi:hypothetical protein
MLASFPRVPARHRATLDATALHPFAGAAALDVDFAGARADVTDAVLARCVEPTRAPAELAALPVSVRIRALLRLAAIETPAVAMVVTCACGEHLEIELPLARVAADPVEVVDAIEIGGGRVRVPTGDDQRELARALAGALADPRLAAAGLVADAAAIAGAGLEAIERALDAADPLVGFHVDATCVACGAGVRHDVDLEALAHRCLARAQEVLVHAIHRLASAYHWTERDVLALPPTRRARYLGLVERGTR